MIQNGSQREQRDEEKRRSGAEEGEGRERRDTEGERRVTHTRREKKR